MLTLAILSTLLLLALLYALAVMQRPMPEPLPPTWERLRPGVIVRAGHLVRVLAVRAEQIERVRVVR